MSEQNQKVFALIKRAVRDVIREEFTAMIKDVYKDVLKESLTIDIRHNGSTAGNSNYSNTVKETPPAKKHVFKEILDRANEKAEAAKSGPNINYMASGNIDALKEMMGDLRNDPIMKIK